MVMETKDIEVILERYGLERILEDNRVTLLEIVDILEQLGYINLEMYQEDWE